MTVKPIIVVGLNRSGTTWLSNLLIGHSRVFGVTAEHQFGVLESNLFGDFQRMFPTLQREDDYAAFASMWSQTDYAQILRADLQRLLKLVPRPSYVLELYRRLMEEETREQNAEFWLQKCSPSQFLDSHSFFPDCKFVALYRDPNEIIRSAVALARQVGTDPSLLRKSLVVGLQHRMLKRVSRLHNGLMVRFSQLKSDTESELRRICEFVGLDYESKMSSTSFRRNTSFQKSAPRPWTSGERIKIGIVRSLTAMMPGAMARTVWNRYRNGRPMAVVNGTYDRLLESQTTQYLENSAASSD